MSYDDDAQISHKNWVQSTDQARQSARECKIKAAAYVPNPHKALWPSVSKSQMTPAHKAAAKAHAAIFDYFEHVEPYSYRLDIGEDGLWSEKLGEFEFPDGEKLPIMLGKLDEWADLRYKEETTAVSELEGRSTTTEIKRVYLPPAYVRTVFRQLNECTDKIDLAADLPEPSYTDTGPEEAL